MAAKAKGSVREALAKEADRLRAVEERIRKLKLREAERLLRLADAAGWFDVEVPDERLAAAFAHLVREAKAAATGSAPSTDAADASPAPSGPDSADGAVGTGTG